MHEVGPSVANAGKFSQHTYPLGQSAASSHCTSTVALEHEAELGWQVPCGPPSGGFGWQHAFVLVVQGLGPPQATTPGVQGAPPSGPMQAGAVSIATSPTWASWSLGRVASTPAASGMSFPPLLLLSIPPLLLAPEELEAGPLLLPPDASSEAVRFNVGLTPLHCQRARGSATRQTPIIHARLALITTESTADILLGTAIGHAPAAPEDGEMTCQLKISAVSRR